jgi:hypothetical protein
MIEVRALDKAIKVGQSCPIFPLKSGLGNVWP